VRANKNKQIAEAERALWAAANKLTLHASREHVTFVMNNLRNYLRTSGHWLDGQATKIRPQDPSPNQE